MFPRGHIQLSQLGHGWLTTTKTPHADRNTQSIGNRWPSLLHESDPNCDLKILRASGDLRVLHPYETALGGKTARRLERVRTRVT